MYAYGRFAFAASGGRVKGLWRISAGPVVSQSKPVLRAAGNSAPPAAPIAKGTVAHVRRTAMKTILPKGKTRGAQSFAQCRLRAVAEGDGSPAYYARDADSFGTAFGRMFLCSALCRSALEGREDLGDDVDSRWSRLALHCWFLQAAGSESSALHHSWEAPKLHLVHLYGICPLDSTEFPRLRNAELRDG